MPLPLSFLLSAFFFKISKKQHFCAKKMANMAMELHIPVLLETAECMHVDVNDSSLII